MDTTSRLPDSINLAFAEELYAQYTRDPASVPEVWREYFHNIEKAANGTAHGAAHSEAGSAVQLGPTFRPAGLFNPAPANGAAQADGARPGHPASVPLSATDGKRNRYLAAADIDPARVRQAYAQSPAPLTRTMPASEAEIAALQDRVDQLIRNHRVRGHMVAQIDPLGLPRE